MNGGDGDLTTPPEPLLTTGIGWRLIGTIVDSVPIRINTALGTAAFVDVEER